jgi:hypothetical protein
MERHEAGQAHVVPIIVEPCDWASIQPLRRLKALPKDGKPVSEWTNANTAYLDVVEGLRRILDAEDANLAVDVDAEPAAAPVRPAVPRYRVQRDFDEIDRSDFREAAFAKIKDYFRRAITEIDAIDGLRGRFVDRGPTSFGSTVINRQRRDGTSHITVHCRNSRRGFSDIYFSFNENADENVANGGFDVSHDDYEQFLVVTMAMFGNEPERLSPGQAAEYLWGRFIDQAGITHD